MKILSISSKRTHTAVFLFAFAACDGLDQPTEDPPAGDPQTSTSSFESIARTGKRSRGNNSQETLPGDRYLSDFNADGITDLIRFAGTQIYLNATDFGETPIMSWSTSRPIRRLITGDFHGDRYDQVCAILDDGSMPCYGISSDRKAAWWWFTQGAIASAAEDSIVGDFDGDGREDVFVYNRSTGAMRMYAMKGDYFLDPMPAFSPGNLTGTPGGMQIRAGDFGGDGRDDLMVINGYGQVLSYASVFDGTNNTFWWAFTSAGGVVGPDDQVTVARIDNNLADDFVLRNRATGATRFHHLDWGNGYPPQITSVPTGQIDISGNSVVRFAPYRGALGEPGGTYRDDAMVFQLGIAGLVRSDARWDGSQYTYWWAYTFYDNPLPVSLYAQETSQWCWAASGQMIMTYLGYPVRQCDEANHATGRTDCCNSPTPSSCVVPGWPDFNYYGFNTSTTPWGTALSWASLRSELVDIGRPVGFSWGWSGGGGHMMVAIGAKTVGTSTYVTVNNPWAPGWGDQSDILYSAYVSGSDHVHWTDYYNIVHR